MQKTPRKPRLPEIHSTIESSGLSKSAKKVLRWLVGSQHTKITFGVQTIARELSLSDRTVRAVLRQLDDTTPDGVGILRLVNREAFGTVPRAYELDLTKITGERLSAASSAADGKAGLQAIRRGKMEGVRRLWADCGFMSGAKGSPTEAPHPGNFPPEISGVEALAEISPRKFPGSGRKFPGISIPTVSDHEGCEHDHHGKAFFLSDHFDEVNADLRAACDEPDLSLAARCIA